MAGTLPPLSPCTGIPVQSNDSIDATHFRKAATITSSDERAFVQSRPSIRMRLQTLFGWKASSRDDQPIARHFSERDALPGIPQRVHATPFLIPSDVGKASADRASQPTRVTGTGKHGRPLGILKMLEDNGQGTTRPSERDSRGARAWKTLAQTSIGLDFERQVAVFAKQKTQELIELQSGIASLPPEIALQYQALLSDIVAYRNQADRDAMLIDLARDVAVRGQTRQ